MSGFFGIFRPQGSPVDPEAFEQMRKATEREGFDGLETYVEEKIALGHLMLRVSPESNYDKQPLKSDCGNYLLVGHFRLDYRDELGDKLGLTQSELELSPDSQLVMLAYKKWKEECVYHIEGDWAFAIFSRFENIIFFAKDIGGYSSLFYCLFEDQIYFSSDLNALVDSNNVPSDIDKNQLCRIGITGGELTNGYTIFKNIFHVKSANFIFINPKLLITENEYWKLGLKQNINYKYDFDCFQDLQSLLSQAIESRSRSLNEVGVFLSAGLDSTTVAYFSSQELKFRNKKLVSYTSFPKFLEFSGSKDSFRFREDLIVRDFIKKFQNIEGVISNFSEAKYSNLLLDPKNINYYFPCFTINTFWLNGVFELAKCKNVKNILNGQLGNYVISWNAPGLDLYLLLRFRLKLFFNRAKNALLFSDITLTKYMKEKVYRPSRLLIKSIMTIFRKSASSSISTNNLIKKSFNEEFVLKNEKKYLRFSPLIDLTTNPRKLRFDILNKNYINIGMKWFGLSHSFALQSTDPTSDSRLVEFSFQIDEQYFNKNGLEKYILKSVMEDKIPQDILSQSKSYFQSIDIGDRLLEDEKLISIISKIKSNVKFQSIVDYSELEYAINQISSQEKVLNRIEFSSKFIKIISLYYFLKAIKYI